nr:peptide BAM12P [Bos taurus]
YGGFMRRVGRPE